MDSYVKKQTNKQKNARDKQRRKQKIGHEQIFSPAETKTQPDNWNNTNKVQNHRLQQPERKTDANSTHFKTRLPGELPRYFLNTHRFRKRSKETLTQRDISDGWKLQQLTYKLIRKPQQLAIKIHLCRGSSIERRSLVQMNQHTETVKPPEKTENVTVNRELIVSKEAAI
ncbi:unnamed protein product [Dovyalis caffra]|uniref:Uncharacterized protein n=1 Tax=Dovyalis caffra TaxID=77055 RepID=A0AAV1RES2_9ROSI|nr:unnamed protein product [Dovyalis caffra]